MVVIDPDVYYSCGACGYPLHLSSSQRATSISGHGSSSLLPSSLRGTSTLSFVSIEGTRIRQLHELRCAPYIHADGSMGLHQSKTKLLCGNCGSVIGHSHSSHSTHTNYVKNNNHSPPHTHVDSGTRYCLKMKALQPCI